MGKGSMGKGRQGTILSSHDPRLLWVKRQLEATLRIGGEEWGAFISGETPDASKKIQVPRRGGTRHRPFRRPPWDRCPMRVCQDFFEAEVEDQCAVIYTAETMVAEIVDVRPDVAPTFM